MSHKKAALITLAFLAALLLGDRGLSFLLKKSLSYSPNRFITLYESDSRADILVLGNSRANRNFTEPELERLLGLKVVNLGLGDVSAVLSEALFFDFIDHHGNPGMLVIEATNLKVNSLEMGNMRLLGLYSERIREIIRNLHPQLYSTSAVFNLFHFNNEVFIRSIMEIFKEYKDKKLYGGISDKLLAILRKKERYTAPDLNDYSQNEAAFLRMLNYADTHNIPVRIILAPYFSVNGPNTDRYPRIWADYLKGLVGDRRIWDYTNLLEDRDLFKDQLHLNTKGARKFHEELISDGVFE